MEKRSGLPPRDEQSEKAALRMILAEPDKADLYSNQLNKARFILPIFSERAQMWIVGGEWL